MKIGVVGLIPPQIEQMKARLKGYTLEFLSRDIESKTANVVTFCKSVDKVILMKRFISHVTNDAVPASKRVLITGGTSMAIERVKQLMGCPVVPAPVNVAPQSAIPTNEFNARPSHAIYKVKPVLQSAKGHPSRTTASAAKPGVAKEILTIRPTATGTYDYAILSAAVPGDIIRFPFPADMDRKGWITRMRSARHYYGTRSAFTLHLELHEKYADIKVIDPNTPERIAAVKELEEKIREVLPAPDVVVQPTSTSSDVLATKDQATAGIDPSLIRTALVGQFGGEERQLWREAFIACFQRGLPAAMAATEADAVLVLYQDRFKISSPVG